MRMVAVSAISDGMHECIFIGVVPPEEECVQVGTPDYARNARIECRAFIEAIRKVCGREPEGARLVVKGQAHDFTEKYYEVAVVFDADNQAAAEYADKVDRHHPATWEEAGMTAPVPPMGRGR